MSLARRMLGLGIVSPPLRGGAIGHTRLGQSQILGFEPDRVRFQRTRVVGHTDAVDCIPGCVILASDSDSHLLAWRARAARREQRQLEAAHCNLEPRTGFIMTVRLQAVSWSGCASS